MDTNSFVHLFIFFDVYFCKEEDQNLNGLCIPATTRVDRSTILTFMV